MGVGDNIKRLREAKGISQRRDLSAAAVPDRAGDQKPLAPGGPGPGRSTGGAREGDGPGENIKNAPARAGAGRGKEG